MVFKKVKFTYNGNLRKIGLKSGIFRIEFLFLDAK